MVHNLGLRHRKLTNTDYSRFDGTHSQAMYDLELALLRRVYPDHSASLTRLNGQMRHATARTKHGVRYLVGGSRVSGAADTSLMNTFCNAAVAYVTFRVMGLPPSEAYDSLGLYGGDDGLTGDVDDNTYMSVAKGFGLKLKVASNSGALPTPFLGRVFLSPMAGPESVPDIPRCFSKLHVTANRNVCPSLALSAKAFGHKIMDPDLPILRNWARLALSHPKVPEHLLSYQVRGGAWPAPS